MNRWLKEYWIPILLVTITLAGVGMATIGYLSESAQAQSKGWSNTTSSDTSRVSIVELEGHKYVVAEKTRYDGGIAILHAPSCKCMKSDRLLEIK